MQTQLHNVKRTAFLGLFFLFLNFPETELKTLWLKAEKLLIT